MTTITVRDCIWCRLPSGAWRLLMTYQDARGRTHRAQLREG